MHALVAIRSRHVATFILERLKELGHSNEWHILPVVLPRLIEDNLYDFVILEENTPGWMEALLDLRKSYTSEQLPIFVFASMKGDYDKMEAECQKNGAHLLVLMEHPHLLRNQLRRFIEGIQKVESAV